MSTVGAGRRWRSAPIAVVAATALVGAGCGSDDFENEPRVPVSYEVTAKVDAKQVVVSPDSCGAGLAGFTIANLSDDPVRFTLDGPVDAASDEIQAGSVGDLKVELEEGDYEVTAGAGADVKPDDLAIGPLRQSAQNDLLLP